MLELFLVHILLALLNGVGFDPGGGKGLFFPFFGGRHSLLTPAIIRAETGRVRKNKREFVPERVWGRNRELRGSGGFDRV